MANARHVNRIVAIGAGLVLGRLLRPEHGAGFLSAGHDDVVRGRGILASTLRTMLGVCSRHGLPFLSWEPIRSTTEVSVVRIGFKQRSDRLPRPATLSSRALLVLPCPAMALAARASFSAQHADDDGDDPCAKCGREPAEAYSYLACLPPRRRVAGAYSSASRPALASRNACRSKGDLAIGPVPGSSRPDRDQDIQVNKARSLQKGIPTNSR